MSTSIGFGGFTCIDGTMQIGSISGATRLTMTRGSKVTIGGSQILLVTEPQITCMVTTKDGSTIVEYNGKEYLTSVGFANGKKVIII
jgi:hypothetical protein